MSKYCVNAQEIEGKKFYYVDFGSETHGRKSFRLWLSSRLITKEKTKDGQEIEVIKFPIKAYVERKESGTLVLKPSENCWTFDVYVPCGYRGDGTIDIRSDFETVHWYYEYQSPKGNLGISAGGLITTKNNYVKIRWERTGRLYGDPPKGIRIYYSDGRIEDIEEIENLEELADLD